MRSLAAYPKTLIALRGRSLRRYAGLPRTVRRSCSRGRQAHASPTHYYSDGLPCGGLSFLYMALFLPPLAFAVWLW
nr:MAG TPA: hypothetical protein [Caudoviricetes sp.]